MRRAEVLELLGVSRQTLYNWMNKGEFPAPVQIGPNAVRWRNGDVADWLASRPTGVLPELTARYAT